MTLAIRSMSLLLALCCGCASVLSHVAVPTPPLPEHGAATLRVGTGRADITMPPGASTFGHGPDARVAEGYWTRAYCRVFYFETDRGQKLVIVPCELASMSLLLQRAVAARVADILHPSQLMMTAIHTHAGVAHYFGESQYTGIFSTRVPGYDQALMRAIAERVALAIRAAKRDARPAKLSWTHAQDFFCFTRNRDLAAYKLNSPPFSPVLPASRCKELEREDARAIDPGLDVLRIDAYDPSDPSKLVGPIGSLSFFAMHPTVIANTNRLFGGDTAGVVNRYVERALRREALALHPELSGCGEHRARPDCPERLPDPLHGVINTDEGDISPIWYRGDIDEAISIGENVGEIVWRHHPAPGSGSASVVLDSRYVEEDVRGAKFHDHDGTPHETCEYPELGQGSARGATDHPTSVAPLHLFEDAAPRDPKDTSCHAPKRPLLGPLSLTTRSDGNFPAHLPLAVAQIGDTLLAFVPAETTLTAGHRIMTRMLDAVRPYTGAPDHAIIAGLANAYIQYVATPEEYQLQGYEGASTLYGPQSNGYLANRMALLSRSMFDPSVNVYLRDLGQTKDVKFSLGPARKRMARPTSEEVQPKALHTCTMPGGDIAPRVCTYWHDRGPGDVPLRQEPWLRVALDAPGRPPVQLCRADDSGACDVRGALDDRGHEFRTRIHDKIEDAWVWSTLFAPSASTWHELAGMRVRIVAGQGAGAPESDAFSPEALPPACTFRQARLCMEGERTEDWDGLVP